MRGILVYTVLRVALLVVTWLLVQVVTPLRGLLAIAVAIIVSGVVGYVLLDRSRDRASASVDRWFRRLDARIEASRIAEDLPDAGPDGTSADPGGEGDTGRQEQTEGEQQQAGGLQDHDEGGSGGPR